MEKGLERPQNRKGKTDEEDPEQEMQAIQARDEDSLKYSNGRKEVTASGLEYMLTIELAGLGDYLRVS